MADFLPGQDKMLSGECGNSATASVAWLINAIVVASLVVIYVAAKLHFFMHHGSPNYAREHIVYWVWMVIIVVLNLVARSFLNVRPR